MDIILAQEKEIALMKDWHQNWYGQPDIEHKEMTVLTDKMIETQTQEIQLMRQLLGDI